jgi:hypothetical protein
MLFYIIVAAGQFDLGNLRQQGWLFDLGSTGTHQTWYKFYSYLGAHCFIFVIVDVQICGCYRFQFGQVWPAVVNSAYPVCFVRLPSDCSDAND